MEQIGPYQVLGKLGEGAMGTVYRVQDPHAPRQLAIKRIKQANDTRVERFLREARALARVQHPGVVRIHHLEPPPQPFIVLELVDGVSLAEHPPLVPREAAQLVHDLCDALAAVHREGIVHRDLKPGNVMVRPTGQPVLLDFGVARDQDAETLTNAGAFVGTLAYLPPEVVRGEAPKPAPAADIYSLGVLLYELLLQRLPFSGPQGEVLSKIASERPPWPRALGVDVDPALEQILQTAMAPTPADRYPTAEAFRDDLANYLAGHSTAAGRAALRRRLSRLLIALGVTALITLASIVAVLATRSAPADPTPPPEAAPEAPTPTPTPPTSTAPPSLWSLRPGQRFAADVTIDERSGIVQYRFDVAVHCEVVASEGTRHVMRFRIQRPAAEIRLTGAGGADRAASDQAPISRVLNRIPIQIEGTLDGGTGALSDLTGFEAIQRGLLAERRELVQLERQLAGERRPQILKALLALFSPDWLGTAFQAMFGVLDPRSPVAWERASPTKTTFFLRERGRAVVVPFRDSILGDTLAAPSQVDVEGEADYRDGRLQRARIRQASQAAGASLAWDWRLRR